MIKYMLKIIAVLSLAMWFSGCGTATKKEEETAVEEVKPSEEIKPEEPIAEPPKQREPYENEIREYARVVGLEDGPYPMFIISLEFPERKMFRDFNLNIESIGLSVEELNNLNNKYVTFYYTSDLDVMLYDLQLKGETVLGPDAFLSDNAKEITGILTGAEAPTASDLPGQITITPAEGEPLTIKYFVTEEMTSANNKEVTAFYSTRTIENLTYLEPSEDQSQ